MSEQQTTVEEKAEQSSRVWKFVRRSLWVIFIVFLLVCGGYYYRSYRIKKELDEAIAKVDQLDPGWRAKELEANRKPIPDAENGALVIQKVTGILGLKWDQPGLELWSLDPQHRLRPDQMRELQAILKRVDIARKEIRSLMRFSQGRFPDRIVPMDPFKEGDGGASIPSVSRLISLDAHLVIEEKKFDEGLFCAQLMLHCAKMLGHQFSVLRYLIRNYCGRSAVLILERTLAQGESKKEKRLIELGESLQQELAPQRFVDAVRGERASIHGLMLHFAQNPESRKIKLFFDPPSWGRKHLPGYFRDEIRVAHAEILPLYPEMLSHLKLPPHELRKQAKQLDARKCETAMAERWRPSFEAAVKARQLHHAQVRTAQVGLALERFRLQHNKWPDSLMELTPKCIKKIPLDPFDGKPLRYRPFEQGVVVYSVGDNGVDDFGNPADSPTGTGRTDETFRLWDVKHRRQPPKPKPKDEFGLLCGDRE